MKLHIIPSVEDERAENRRAHTDSELFRFAQGLAESLLPEGYLAYRAQVDRWRSKVDDANFALVESVIAREKADKLLEDAVELDNALRDIEASQPNWVRAKA